MESKSDLIKEEEKNEREIKNFAKQNGFDGGFLVSSKTGKNINESMEFLINTIIERLWLIKYVSFFCKNENLLKFINK